MRDPLTLRILGLLLVLGGGLVVGFAWYDRVPDLFGWDKRTWMIAGGIAAGLGALLIVSSAYFRRGRHGLGGKPHRRTGKPSALKRLAMFWGGLVLVIISPIVGAIPGPGGIIVFAAGFGLMLRGSLWVKKKYAAFKRRHPKKGEWADFGLQRLSYKRRQARAKALAAGEAAPLPVEDDKPQVTHVREEWVSSVVTDGSHVVHSERRVRVQVSGAAPPEPPKR